MDTSMTRYTKESAAMVRLGARAIKKVKPSPTR